MPSIVQLTLYLDDGTVTTLPAPPVSTSGAPWVPTDTDGVLVWQAQAGGTGDATQMMLEVAGVRALALSRAPQLNPTLLGIPTVPTAAPGTNTKQAASTAFVAAAVAATTVSGDSDQIILASQIFGA